MKNNLLNKAALIIEFSAFILFALLTFGLYYALTHQPPIPPAEQLDNDFVPLLLLFLLLVGTCVFGSVFAVHSSVWRIKISKEKRKAANRLP